MAATYYLIDDTGTSGGGGGSGKPVSAEFTTLSLADAQTVAQIFATTFNRSVRLVPLAGAPPYTPLFSANTACRVFPSSAPTSVTF